MTEVDDKAGTVIAVLQLPFPWPTDRRVSILGRDLTFGKLRVFCEPPNLIRACISTDDAPVLEVVSCPIELPAPLAVFLAIRWERPQTLEILPSTTTVASSISPEQVPTHHTVQRGDGIGSAFENFSEENRKSQQRRRDKVVGSHRIPNRIPGGSEYIFSALRQEILQLRDLLRMIRDGALHHGPGVAARLRLLVAQGNPLPLLQLCAADRDLPLPLYTDDNPSLSVPFSPSTYIGFNLSSRPDDICRNPIDLDTLLDLKAASIADHDFTHRQVIKLVGNTVGSHVDRDILPLVASLRSQNSQGRTGLETDFLLQYIEHWAYAALDLSERTLSHKETNSRWSSRWR